MSESDGGLRALFRANLRRGFDWQSIESGLTAAGVPDSNYCCRGAEGWVEFKQTVGWTPKVRPGQVGWLSRRARAGGRVWIAVRRWPEAGTRRVGADELWMVRGGWAAALRADGLRGLPGAAVAGGPWPGGPARWPWPLVADLLVGEGGRGGPDAPPLWSPRRHGGAG